MRYAATHIIPIPTFNTVFSRYLIQPRVFLPVRTVNNSAPNTKAMPHLVQTTTYYARFDANMYASLKSAMLPSYDVSWLVLSEDFDGVARSRGAVFLLAQPYGTVRCRV